MLHTLSLPALAGLGERRRRRNGSSISSLPANASASQPLPQRSLGQQQVSGTRSDRVRTSFSTGTDVRPEVLSPVRRQGTVTTEAEAGKLMMSFSARCQLPFGDRLFIVGSCDELSSWDLSRALPCEWHDGDLWRIQVALPEREVIRYKFVVRRANGVFQWQPGEDSTTLASASAAVVSESLNDALRFDVIRVNSKLEFGEDLLIVGSHPNLGAWDPAGGVPMTWTDGDVWQANVALPRNEDVEFKLVRRLKGGMFVFSEGENRTLPPITKFEPPSSALNSVPITRHVHHQDGRWFVPWYWAAELGRADAVVTLVDPAAMAMSVEDGINAALDVAALVEARASHYDGLRTGGGRPAADIAAETLEAFRSLQARVDSKAVAATGVVGGGAAALTVGINASGGIAGLGAAGEALGVALQPVMEVAVIGTILALGAKNLLFAEDRKKFVAALEGRETLLALLRDNVMAMGVVPEASGATPAFDPLGLAGGGEAAAPVKLSIGKGLTEAAGKGSGAGTGAGETAQDDATL